MAAATEDLGDLGYIDLTFTANAQTKLTFVREFAKKYGRLDSGDTDEVVNDTLAIFCGCPGVIHITISYPTPCQLAIALHVGKSGAQQPNLAFGIGEEEIARDLTWICTTGRSGHALSRRCPRSCWSS